MPPLNTATRQPMAALWYTTLPALALAVFVVLLGIFFIGGAQNSCEGTGCGFLSPSIVGPVVTIVAILIVSYPTLYYILFSYLLTEHTMTVNSGILFREYETFDFGRIQVIDLERGPLLWLFGLTEVRVWTASADQLSFSVGTRAATAHPHPDATLILDSDDAQEIKDFIMRAKTSSVSSGL
jgi:membrane protein YdbS with pleckstrin-like domain